MFGGMSEKIREPAIGRHPQRPFAPIETVDDDFHLGIGRHQRVERGIEPFDLADRRPLFGRR